MLNFFNTTKRFGEVPIPVKSIVTHWGTDPFSKGTYSFIGVGSTGDDYDALAKPIDNRIFFAGEATIREHPATAAGAYLSGLRTAGYVDKVFVGDIKVDFNVETVDTQTDADSNTSASKRSRGIVYA